MAYRFIIECEDEREFARLLRDRFLTEMWAIDRRAQERSRLRERDVQALREMAKCDDGMTSQEFAVAIGQPVKRLGPVIRGISQRIPLFDDYVSQVRTRDDRGRTVRRYRLTETGRKFVQQNR
jgi:hypothetical protein